MIFWFFWNSVEGEVGLDDFGDVVGNFRVKVFNLVGEDGIVQLNLIFLLFGNFFGVFLVWCNLFDGIGVQGRLLFWVRKDVQFGIVDDENQFVQDKFVFDYGVRIYKVNSNMENFFCG